MNRKTKVIVIIASILLAAASFWYFSPMICFSLSFRALFRRRSRCPWNNECLAMAIRPALWNWGRRI